jgi:hypothetical protein
MEYEIINYFHKINQISQSFSQMIQTIYDQNSNIISTNYIGKIDATELIGYIEKISIDDDSYKYLLYLEDQTQAEFIFKPAEIKNIVNALYSKINTIPCVRVAVINTNPKETAFSLIALRLLKAKNLRAKIFYTKEAAINWLLLAKMNS